MHAAQHMLPAGAYTKNVMVWQAAGGRCMKCCRGEVAHNRFVGETMKKVAG